MCWFDFVGLVDLLCVFVVCCGMCPVVGSGSRLVCVPYAVGLLVVSCCSWVGCVAV